MKKGWIIGLIVLGIIIVLGLIWYFVINQPKSPPASYDLPNQAYRTCAENYVKNYLEEQRYLPPASSEGIGGAVRTDKNGSMWVKQANDSWTSECCYGTSWGDAMIDEQPGGVNYTPSIDLNNIEECLQYSNRNLELESNFSYIINEEIISENLSIDSIIVENRENGILGEVYISCPEDSYELLDNGRGIIGNISEILFRDYPALFIENDKSSLRINFYCGGEWVIENGKYNTIYYYD